MNKLFLLIDDDVDDKDLFAEALQEVDGTAECKFASNGENAFEVLKHIRVPNVIFLDINMPVMNGWECLRKLKSDGNYKNIPVIMYSTSSHQHEISNAVKEGALEFISKPHDYKELKSIISGVLKRIG